MGCTRIFLAIAHSLRQRTCTPLPRDRECRGSGRRVAGLGCAASRALRAARRAPGTAGARTTRPRAAGARAARIRAAGGRCIVSSLPVVRLLLLLLPLRSLYRKRSRGAAILEERCHLMLAFGKRLEERRLQSQDEAARLDRVVGLAGCVLLGHGLAIDFDPSEKPEGQLVRKRALERKRKRRSPALRPRLSVGPDVAIGDVSRYSARLRFATAGTRARLLSLVGLGGRLRYRPLAPVVAKRRHIRTRLRLN